MQTEPVEIIKFFNTLLVMIEPDPLDWRSVKQNDRAGAVDVKDCRGTEPTEE
jgi:hypothetical protein